MNWGLRMAEKECENNILDEYFKVARHRPPTPPNALMARVLADAVAAQDASERPRGARAPSRPWRDFLRVVGGWPAMAGLASAAVAGLWLGIAPPAALPDAANAYLGLGDAGYLVDAPPGFGFDLLEEAL